MMRIKIKPKLKKKSSYQNPKPMPKETPVDNKTKKGDYRDLPQNIIDDKILSLNQRSLHEIDVLEAVIRDYETLVSLMEIEWQPKLKANPAAMAIIARIHAKLRKAAGRT